MNQTNKPRIAWFTSEGETSRAWYLWKTIAPYLAEKFDVTLFGSVTNGATGLKSYLAAYDYHRKNPFDLFVYNLEDTHASYFSRFALGLIPGVVFFHDFLLLTDGPEPIHNSAWEIIREAFTADGRWPVRNTSHERHGPWASRESSFALGGLFFSPWAHQEWFGKKRNGYIEERPSSSVWYPAKIATERCAAGERYAAFTGRPSVEDRAVSVLRAVKKTNSKLHWLIDVNEERKAKELIHDEKAQKNVTLFVERTPEKWREVVKAAMVALHPRMSVYGDTGPYLEVSMAMGVPTVVTDFGRSSYIPDTACLKVTPGTSESAELEVVLTELHSAPVAMHDAGINFAKEHIAPPIVAHEVSLFIERTIPLSRKFLGQWRGFEEKAKRDLLVESWEGWNFSDPLVKTALEPHFKELFGA